MSFSTRSLPGRAALATLALGLTFSACDDNAPTGGAGEEELVTRVRITLTNPTDASEVLTITATDSDGDGSGLVFSPSSVTLAPGTTYDAAITLDDTANGVSITGEVADEAEEHLFRYAFSPSSAGTVTITDAESDYTTNTGADLPVGLAFRVAIAASATGSGTFNATLFHFEDAGAKSSATSTSDERDIDVDFPVTFSGPAFAGPAGGN